MTTTIHSFIYLIKIGKKKFNSHICVCIVLLFVVLRFLQMQFQVMSFKDHNFFIYNNICLKLFSCLINIIEEINLQSQKIEKFNVQIFQRQTIRYEMGVCMPLRYLDTKLFNFL